MAIDWIYDTTYVSFGVDWDAHYKAVGYVTLQPRVYRRDSYNTEDSSSFDETLRYEPNGSTGSWTETWGSGSGTRNVDTFGIRTYQRQASAYTVKLEIETSSGFGTAYDGYYHTIGVVSRTSTYTVPALPPAFNTITATRVSDNQVNISWTAASGNIEAVCIERSTDGGSYSEVAVIWSASATSWQDTATSADHFYTYRARYFHGRAYGTYSNEVAISMTPLPPQSITTAAIQGSTDIAVTLENNSPVATSLVWEVSTDGGSTWSAGSTSPVAGTPVTSFTATGISGTAYIRVANANATGTSAWLVSEAVTTICPPAAPTIVAPAGSIVNIADGSMTIEWLFNSLDGSAQTAYEVSLSKNGGAAVTQSGTTATKLTITFSGLTPNSGDTLTFKVRTKGADANWSDWSSTKTVTLYTPPTVAVTSPSATVTSMPLSITASYTDAAGTCKAASYYIAGNGQRYPQEGTLPLAITTSGGATTLSASVPVSAFLPANDAQYTVYITARSSSSLQTSANATFTTAFIEPVAGELSMTNDPETGYVSLMASFDAPDTVSYSGSTNDEQSSQEGFVQSLTVNGKSEVQNGSIVSIESVSVGDKSVNATLRSLPDGTCDVLSVDASGNVTVTRNVGYLDYSTDETWTNSTNTNSAGLNYIQADIDVIAPITYEQNSDRCYSSIPMSNKNFSGTTIESFGINSVLNGTHRVYWRYNAQGGAATVTNGLARMQTLGAVLLYPLATPVTETLASVGTISIGDSFTVETELNSTFSMTIADGVAADSVSVSRVNPDGSITPLITDGASGSGVVDKYAPLNTPYQYAVTTTAATQAVKTVYVDNELVTDLWFAYWTHRDGETVTEMTASAKWNPENGGIQVTRPQKTRVYYAGRRDPVSYDGHAVALTETPSWMFIGKDEVDAFVKLIEDGGRGVYKSCDGWVYHADFDLTLTPAYTAIGYYGGASLGITRIAGERL